MESPFSPCPVFGRRAIIRSALSPEPLTRHLLSLLIDDNPGSSDTPNASIPVPGQPCLLCHYEDTLDDTDHGVVKETLMTLMGKVGIDLQTKDLSFCSFCSAQLGNLVALKREMDRLGDALGAMIVGLRSLFPQENEISRRRAGNQDERGERFDCNSPITSAHHQRSDDDKDDHLIGNDTAETEMTTSLFQINRREPATNPQTRFQSSVSHPSLNGQKVQKDLPDLLFLCSDCNRTFRHKSNLTRHILIHTGERRWACDLCPRRFTHKWNKEKHMKTHLPPQERLCFSCPHCPQRFGRKDRFKVHVASHPSIHIPPNDVTRDPK